MRAFIQCQGPVSHAFAQSLTNVILTLTYQLHGQETTGTPQLCLVTTQGFRLHHVRVQELNALICYVLLCTCTV